MKSLIVANWKMNPKSLKEAKVLFNLVKQGIKNLKNVEVVICPPFTFLENIKYKTSNIKLGAQDCFWEVKGAFTGEISPVILKNLGVEYVILGHSERRKYLKETDEMINRKIKAAMKSGLKPILCVGNAGQDKNWQDIIIAFEPISAIGMGKPLSWQKAKKIRESLVRFQTVLYGGSVNSKNAKDYIQKAGFQGLLVGGASLDAQEFVKILELV